MCVSLLGGGFFVCDRMVSLKLHPFFGPLGDRTPQQVKNHNCCLFTQSNIGFLFVI